MKSKLLLALVFFVIIGGLLQVGAVLAASPNANTSVISRPAWLPDSANVKVDVNLPFFLSPDGHFALLVIVEDESQLAGARLVLAALEGWKNTASTYPPLTGPEGKIEFWIGVYLPLGERQNVAVEAHRTPKHFEEMFSGVRYKGTGDSDAAMDEPNKAIKDKEFPKALQGAIARVLLKAMGAKPIIVTPTAEK